MKLLGLRLCEHDSNLSYYDGNSLRYHKTERFYQKKHHAVNDVFKWKEEIYRAWGITEAEIDEIAIIVDAWKYEDCGFDRFFPAINWNFLNTNIPTTRLNHHYAHVLSNYEARNITDVSIVIDGYGDYGVGHTVFKDNLVKDIGTIPRHGSLGIEMCMLAESLGIKAEHFADLSGKLMGLQSFGKLDKEFYSNTIRNYGMFNLRELFSFQRWVEYKNNEVLATHTKLDWVKTLHDAIGEILLNYFKNFANKTDTINYTGGVAQNVIWNSKIRDYFPNLIIPPHCADDGLSLGAVEYLRIKNGIPEFNLNNFPYSQDDTSTDCVSDEIIAKTSQALSENKVVAWYQGNGEVGPRALGNRSILINAADKFAKEKINNIKNREQYRPFGATVLEEYKDDIFSNLGHNPYMLYVGNTKDKEKYSSITHVDGTCRVQTISKKDNKSFYKLLKLLYNKTNVPVVLNTSLNIAGNPIAGDPQDAYKLYETSEIDVLVIGNQYYEKM
jgi:carbamoyltransferase